MKPILFVIVFFAGSSVFAQKFNMSYFAGPQESSISSAVYKDDIFYFDLENQKGLTNYAHSITLKRYDKKSGVVKSMALSKGEKIYGPVRPMLKVYNDKLYIFYYKSQGDEKMQMLSSQINPENLELSEPVELLICQPNKRNLGFYNRSVNHDNDNRVLDISYYTDGPKGVRKTFFFEPSPDGSKVLLMWSTGWDNKIFYSILDKELKKIKSGEKELSPEGSVALGSACIDNSGKLYIVYHYSVKRRHIAEMITIESAGKTSVSQINIPGSEVSAVFLNINKTSNTVNLTGTYKQNSDNLTGVFVQEMNSTNSRFGKAELTPFPSDLVEILDDEGFGSNKKNYGLFEAWFVHPFVLNDGTLSLVGEFRSNVSGERASFALSGSILVARFNKNKAVFSRIPKIRVSAGSTYGDSYKLFENKNQLVFYYSDHLDNLKLDMSKKPRRSDNYSNSVFVAAVVTETGSVKREMVVDFSKENYLAENQSMLLLSPSSYYVPFREIKSRGGLTDNFKWAMMSIN